MKQIDKYLAQVFNNKKAKWFIDQFAIWTLAFVFILFGILKVLDISPVREIVEESFFIFEHNWAFFMLGLIEVILGIGLLIKKTRKYAAILIIGHLLGTIATAILTPSITFDSQTVVTTHGEFVAKNFVLIAVALGIVRDEEL